VPLKDTEALRGFLTQALPGLAIDGVPAPSGQRVVYFCHFSQGPETDPEWVGWGPVVLKVSEGISAQAIAYIQREIRILGELKAPGYPALLYNEVFSVDPDTEVPLPYRRFITLEERIDAQPLSNLRAQFANEADVLRLLTDLVRVLQPLWGWKPPLVHRDLKPENILITPQGEVVVIDLGIVREQGAAGETQTFADFGPCTPHYASPEQATNDKRNITFKSDLFSLGVLCYELLAGSNPFAEGCKLIDEVLARVVKHAPLSLEELGLCSSEFSRVIERMMEKEPYKRYRRIEDLIADLEGLAGGV